MADTWLYVTTSLHAAACPAHAAEGQTPPPATWLGCDDGELRLGYLLTAPLWRTLTRQLVALDLAGKLAAAKDGGAGAVARLAALDAYAAARGWSLLEGSPQADEAALGRLPSAPCPLAVVEQVHRLFGPDSQAVARAATWQSSKWSKRRQQFVAAEEEPF